MTGTYQKTKSINKDNGVTYQKTAARGLLRVLVYAFAGFMLAGVQMTSGVCFAGVAFVAAVGADAVGFISMAAVIVGYFVFGGPGEAMHYMAACLFVYTIAYLFQYVFTASRVVFMSVVTAVTLGIVNAFGVVSSVRNDGDLLYGLCYEMVGGGFFAYIYAKALEVSEKKKSRSDINCFLFLVSGIFNSIGGIPQVGDVCPASVAAMAFVMLLVYKYDMYTCFAAAVMIGYALDLRCQHSNMICFLISTLCCTMVSRTRLMIAVSFSLCSFVLRCVRFGATEIFPYLSYMIAVLGLFYVLSIVHWPIYVMEDERSIKRGEGERLVLAHNSYRIGALSDLMSEIGRQMRKTVEMQQTEVELMEVFDHAGEMLCESCEKRRICWEHEMLDMLLVMEDSAHQILRRGKMLETDLPNYFIEHCPYSRGFVTAVNYELRKINDNRQFEQRRMDAMKAFSEHLENASVMTKQYACFNFDACTVDREAERCIGLYLEERGLKCAVGVFSLGNNKRVIGVWGEDTARLVRSSDYINDLSDLIGYRLAVHSQGKSAVYLTDLEPYTVSVGVSGKRKAGEKISGDCVRCIKSDSGTLYVMLSDGIGGGEFAAQQSAAVTSMMEKLLTVLHEPKAAIDILNSMMFHVGKDDWCYATLDLIAIDLYSGEASMYKLGAADSILVSKDRQTRISGNVYSVGMSESVPAECRCGEIKLHPKDTIIMLSDGVKIDEGASLERMVHHSSGNMKMLSGDLLRNAIDQTNDDDMTVVALTLGIRP